MRRAGVIGLALCALSIVLAAPTLASAANRNIPVSPEYGKIVAQDYWEKRGVYVPCDVQIYRITRAEMRLVRLDWGNDTGSLWEIPTCSIFVSPASWRNRFDYSDGPFDFCYQLIYGMGYLAGAGDLAERIRHVPWGCDTNRHVRRKFLRYWEAKFSEAATR